MPLIGASSHTPVWKLSHFAREGDHTVAHNSMLRTRGVRAVSIT